MGRYRRKPVQLEAVRWSGIGFAAMPRWLRDAAKLLQTETPAAALEMDTAEGMLIVTPGDWITRDDDGKIVVLEDPVFRLLFEAV